MDLRLRKESVDDYSDLGSPIDFKYNGIYYCIPAVTSPISKKLIKMSREISKKSEENEKRVKEYVDSGQEIPEELEEESGKLFDFQLEFIRLAGIKKVEFEGDVPVLKEVSQSEMEDIWPNKLTSKIFKLVNSNMLDMEQEKKS